MKAVLGAVKFGRVDRIPEQLSWVGCGNDWGWGQQLGAEARTWTKGLELGAGAGARSWGWGWS